MVSLIFRKAYLVTSDAWSDFCVYVLKAWRSTNLWPGADEPVDYLMALRGVAVLGVALGHLFGIGPLSVGVLVSHGSFSYRFHFAERYETWRTALELVTPLYGTNFVILFFVQSGYLMGKIFFNGRYDARTGKRHFLLARILRLAPLLYLNLLVCLMILPHPDLTATNVAGEFLFITNFTGGVINLVTWSLSHELQYYLICPFVFLLFQKANVLNLVAVSILVALGFYLPHVFPMLEYFRYLPAFLTGFAVNLVLMILPFSLSNWQKSIGLMIGVLLLHLLYNWLFFQALTQEALICAVLLSAGLVVVCEATTQMPVTKSNPIMRSAILMGFLTYGFYLWHYPLLLLCRQSIEEFVLLISSTLSMAGWSAVILYHIVEIGFVGAISFIVSVITFKYVETKFRPSLYSNIFARQTNARLPHKA